MSPRSLNRLLNSLALLVLTTLAVAPILLLSQQVVESLIRDNLNYFYFYDNLFLVETFKGAYLFFSAVVGASEPLSFLYLYVFSKIGVAYPTAILIKNLVFTWVIWRFVATKLRLTPLTLLFLIYIATDFYLFRLMGELQRLSMAAILLLLPFALTPRYPLLSYVAAVLSHLQVIILAPLLVLERRRFILGTLGLLLVAPVIVYLGARKLSVYLDLRPEAVAKTLALSVPFFVISLVAGKAMLISWLRLTFVIAAAAFLLGTERVIVFYWEISILTLFIFAKEVGYNRARMLPFYLFLICFAIPYNSYRLYTEWNFLHNNYQSSVNAAEN
ncbi:hypothetical protein [Rubellimicrobium arenae]|uniref:hypothetical protein n=1 Tax=Rubellimicrobium arenae TaxID=2817372 RepID=UPI001B309F94|nr:hypothetical protein [Rubellimicrobium arenae]